MQERKPGKNFKIKKVTIFGVIPSFAFQRAKYCAMELHRKLPQKFPLPQVIGLVELDWSEKLLEWRQTFGREYWCLRRPVAVFFNDRFIGSDIELLKLSTIGNILIENVPRKNICFIKDEARKDYISYLKDTKRIYCYLDICVDEVYIGTLTFELYSDILPRTCENFKTLCLGTRGPLLSYKGSRIHRIVKKGWLQGGDIQYKTGGGGFSIFCDPLEDECFEISHNRRGVLSMANGGRHRNGSQFFITLNPNQWMDNHFVAFGQLIEGVRVLRKLENMQTMYECPLEKIEIKNCGKLDLSDVEDVDAMYKEEPLPTKEHKKIETITKQIVRLIMEALTDALARKEYSPDILDDGDIPSSMNLHLYFQGFYSISEEVLEQSAKYLRSLRRELLRVSKPCATEVVEVIMYDLLMAVLSRMANLDDVRETMGYDFYAKMLNEINLNIESCLKSDINKLIDQIVATAETMVNLVNKKLVRMKNASGKIKRFQEVMTNWVQSFVIQETFQSDCYHIARRANWALPEIREAEKKIIQTVGKECCPPTPEEQEKEETFCKVSDLSKEKGKGSEILCKESVWPPEKENEKLFKERESFFKTCWYDIKRAPKEEEEEKARIPLLDLIEMSRYRLRCIRNSAKNMKSRERICLERRIKNWMDEVIYIPETSWIRDMVFAKDDIVCKHVEEIMYGAMTAGLLEMYYFVEQYLKQCGGKKKKLITKIIYPEEESEEEADKQQEKEKKKKKKKVRSISEIAIVSSDSEEEEEEEEEEGEGFEFQKRKLEVGSSIDVSDKGSKGKEKQIEDKKKQQETFLPQCTCGHPCCVCKFDPNYKEVLSRHSSVKEGMGVRRLTDVSRVKSLSRTADEGLSTISAIGSDNTSAFHLPKFSLTLDPKEIHIRSFKWLETYIIEKGCDLKSEFAAQVHRWLDGEEFNYGKFFSKHSLVTKASLLSLSLSLAALIKEDNQLKTEIQNFIYDLWSLYFDEMFKEALLEFPPEVREPCQDGKMEGDKDENKEEEGDDEDDICKKLAKQNATFDYDGFCADINKKKEGEEKEIKDNLTGNVKKSEDAVLGGEIKEKKESEKSLASRRKSVVSERILMDDETKSLKDRKSKILEEKSKESFEEGKKPVEESKSHMEKKKSVQIKSKESIEREDSRIKDEQKLQLDNKKSVEEQKLQPGERKSILSQKGQVEKEKSITNSKQLEGKKSVQIEEIKSYHGLEESQPSAMSGGKGVRKSTDAISESRSLSEEIMSNYDLDKAESKDSSRESRPLKRKKSPIIIQECVEVSSVDSRDMPPYVLPFWVEFLTQLTKQVLGAIAKLSRLPRRLYFLSDSVMNFDDKMKDWLEFNAFNPQPTKGREITDYFLLHHKPLKNLDESARSYLKKKKYSGLINRCTRITSADDMVGEIVADVVETAIEKNKSTDAGELVASLLSSAMGPTREKSEKISRDYVFETEGSRSSRIFSGELD